MASQASKSFSPRPDIRTDSAVPEAFTTSRALWLSVFSFVEKALFSDNRKDQRHAPGRTGTPGPKNAPACVVFAVMRRRPKVPGYDASLSSRDHFLRDGSTSTGARRTTGLFGMKRKIYLGPYAVKTAEYSHLEMQSEA
jgi:hypothetical protein